MGLSSFKFEQWAPKVASFLRHSAFWPFKVIQGHDFGTNRKRIYDFLLVINSNYSVWSYLAPFLRYGDLLAENCLFLPPLSHSVPSLPMFPLEFRTEVNHEETRVMGLSSSEDRVIVAGVVLTQCQRLTDGRTDGRTDLL